MFARFNPTRSSINHVLPIPMQHSHRTSRSNELNIETLKSNIENQLITSFTHNKYQSNNEKHIISFPLYESNYQTKHIIVPTLPTKHYKSTNTKTTQREDNNLFNKNPQKLYDSIESTIKT